MMKWIVYTFLEALGMLRIKDSFSYIIAIKSIERVADHAVSISRVINTISSSAQSNFIELTLSMYSKSLELFEYSVRALQKSEITIDYPFSKLKEIEELNETLVNKIVSSCKDIKFAVDLRLVVESIKRVAEYSADIAEATINIKVQ